MLSFFKALLAERVKKERLGGGSLPTCEGKKKEREREKRLVQKVENGLCSKTAKQYAQQVTPSYNNVSLVECFIYSSMTRLDDDTRIRIG